MPTTTQAAISRYRQAHRQMYGEPPRDLRASGDVILLHGLAVTPHELDVLAAQLEADYTQASGEQPGKLRRILDWLNQ